MDKKFTGSGVVVRIGDKEYNGKLMVFVRSDTDNTVYNFWTEAPLAKGDSIEFEGSPMHPIPFEQKYAKGCGFEENVRSWKFNRVRYPKVLGSRRSAQTSNCSVTSEKPSPNRNSNGLDSKQYLEINGIKPNSLITKISNLRVKKKYTQQADGSHTFDLGDAIGVQKKKNGPMRFFLKEKTRTRAITDVPKPASVAIKADPTPESPESLIVVYRVLPPVTLNSIIDNMSGIHALVARTVLLEKQLEQSRAEIARFAP